MKIKRIFFLFTLILIAVLIIIPFDSKKHNKSAIETAIETNMTNSTSREKINKVQTPEKYGANGFDKNDDTMALQKAIHNGHVIVLKSGATYTIDRPIVINHSIKIVTDKTNAATIVQKEKTNALVVENKPILFTHVKQQMKAKQSYVILADTKGIKPGVLIHLKSSRLWYWDDRGYLKKGELHKVTKVVGDKVYLDQPIVENYLVGKGENVSAALYPSVSLQMDNISFVHPKLYNSIMMVINYTMNTKLDRISVKNSKRIGILLNATYHTIVNKANVELGTTKDITSGYGIQDYGGTGTVIDDSIFKRCRRGVDFSGVTPSRYGVVKNSKSYGYKKGTLASGNSGFGTHSTAENITFINNYVENYNYGFLIRGRNITVEQNTLKGLSISFMAISFGNHAIVNNNVYQSTNGSALSMFVLFLDSYKGSIAAYGNKVHGLNGPFIQGKIGNLESLSLGDNAIYSK